MSTNELSPQVAGAITIALFVGLGIFIYPWLLAQSVRPVGRWPDGVPWCAVCRFSGGHFRHHLESLFTSASSDVRSVPSSPALLFGEFSAKADRELHRRQFPSKPISVLRTGCCIACAISSRLQRSHSIN